MDWSYFIENGKFVVKRLPSTKEPIKIKDTTDNESLRDFRSDELLEVNTLTEAINAYANCFRDPIDYEVDIETFEDFFERNPNNFLKDLKILKNDLDLYHRIKDWNDYSEDWIYLESKLAHKLQEIGFATIKTVIGTNDWEDYLQDELTVPELKKLAKKNSIEVKGKKSDIVNTLINAIIKKEISPNKPTFIQPGPKVNNWIQDLEIAYVNAFEEALSSFDYPRAFKGSMWDEVIINNSDCKYVANLVTARHNHLLPGDKNYPYEIITVTVNENELLAKTSIALPIAPKKPQIFTTIKIEQGSPIWLEWRKGGIGASEASAILGTNPWKSRDQLMSEKLDPNHRSITTPAMERGTKLEPRARKRYIAETGNQVSPMCLQSNNHSWLKASVDGINIDKQLLVEIKCGESIYNKIFNGFDIPPYYYTQLQHILAITGYDEIDFWCYLPGKTDLLTSVDRDDEYIEELIEVENHFWNELISVRETNEQ